MQRDQAKADRNRTLLIVVASIVVGLAIIAYPAIRLIQDSRTKNQAITELGVAARIRLLRQGHRRPGLRHPGPQARGRGHRLPGLAAVVRPALPRLGAVREEVLHRRRPARGAEPGAQPRARLHDPVVPRHPGQGPDRPDREDLQGEAARTARPASSSRHPSRSPRASPGRTARTSPSPTGAATPPAPPQPSATASSAAPSAAKPSSSSWTNTPPPTPKNPTAANHPAPPPTQFAPSAPQPPGAFAIQDTQATPPPPPLHPAVTQLAVTVERLHTRESRSIPQARTTTGALEQAIPCPSPPQPVQPSAFSLTYDQRPHDLKGYPLTRPPAGPRCTGEHPHPHPHPHPHRTPQHPRPRPEQPPAGRRSGEHPSPANPS